MIHVIVERRKPAIPGVPEYLVEAAFLSLPGKQRNAECLGFAQVVGHFRQHGDASRNVEAADADRQSRGPERTREIHGARKLVGLDADQADQCLAAGCTNVSEDTPRPDPPVGLVISVQANFNVTPKDAPLACVLGERIQACERVGGNG